MTLWKHVRMSSPVIGVSVYFEQAKWGAWDIRAAELPFWYLDLFQLAGGRIVLLPPDTNADALDRLDGLVLVGGADVDARSFGAEPHPTADAPRESRDQSEFLLYRGARDRSMPVLGICRGLQIMAIAHGGSLIQNLPDLGLSTVHREVPGQFVEHGARFAAGSLIARLMGGEHSVVNSSHHQAVESAGDLTVTGWADDGTIEVCEDPQADFCIGVQWHPEHPDRRLVDAGLITAFLSASERYRKTTPLPARAG